MNRGLLGLIVIGFFAYVATKLNETHVSAVEYRKIAIAPSASSNGADKLPEPFIATIDNEHQWQPDILPVDWPKFAVNPAKQPLPVKTTDQKLEIARSVQQRWNLFKYKSSKTRPSIKETGLAIDYLLSIKRDDPKFAEAWALFIDARAIDRAVGDYELRRKRGVVVGMTAEEVLQSNWGKPQKINETITTRGRHEQWVYGGGYLYLDDGILTSIQTSR